MPATSGQDVFNSLGAPSGTAPPARPADLPAEKAMSGEDVFASLTAPPTMKERAAAVAKKGVEIAKGVGGKLADVNRALSEQAQEQVFGPIAQSFADSYVDFVDQWRNYQKGQGTLADLDHYARQAFNVLNMTVGTGTGAAAVQKAVVDPIHQEIEKIGEKVAKGDKYTQHDFDALADMFDMAYWTAFGMKGAEPAIPGAAKAGARMALKNIREAVVPPEKAPLPKGTEEVSAALDNTMGFQGVRDGYGKELQKMNPGASRPAGEIIEKMLPDSKGYAKGFLSKLQEHMDKDVPVTFTSQRQAKGYAGFYRPDTHEIVLQAGADNIVHTAVHEIVHSVTVNMLDDLMAADIGVAEAEAGRALEPQEKLALISNPRSPILKELDDIIKETRIRAAKAGRFQDRKDFEIIYALDPSRGYPLKGGEGLRDLAFRKMSPRYEFIAQLFSSTDLQEFMANSEKYASAGYKWKNMLNQFTQLIGRHLGMKGQEMQLLSQAMRVGTQLIKLHDVTKPALGGIAKVVGKLGDEVITQGEMDSATRIVGKLDTPRTRAAERTMRISIEQLKRTFAPEALGEKAKLAAATISSRLSELERSTARWLNGSQTRAKFWRARPDMQREFLEKAERGEKFSDPNLQKMADHYKAWAQRIFEQDMKNGFQYEARENYFSHIFEESPEDIAAYFNEHYGSKWGDPSFIKERSFDLYKEAIAAGFHPRFESPEDIMLARQHATDVAEMHKNILEDLARFGLATKKIKTKEEFRQVVGPEGKVSWEVERTEGTKQPENTTRRRAPNGDIYWVDNQAFAVVKNAFDSYSLWADKGGVGASFRGMMALKNSVIPIRLALSLFHPLHVMGIDIAAGITRASTELLSGRINPATFLGKLVRSGLNPFVEAANVPLGALGINKGGWRVIKAWQGKIKPEALTAEDAEALKVLVETGISPELSSQYRTNARQNFANAVRDAMAGVRTAAPGRVVGGATRATWHLPWAIISAMSKPIFEQWIPALKATSAIKDAQSLLERNPELAENDAARLIQMRRIGKSVDNRYGEMAYNKLFWQRWAKDLAVLNTLSLGWQLGFIREYGGGALDLGQFAKGAGKLARIGKGELDKPIFVASYTALGAGMAGIMTYAFTGEYPTGMDWINPRIGGKNPDGSDRRVTTMFYSREFASLYKHMENEGAASGVSDLVLNKGSGMVGLVHEWATGVNTFGQEIRDPSGDPFQKIEQTAAYTLSDLEPISMQAIQQNMTDEPGKAGALTVLGFNPEPKYMSETVTQAHIKAAFRDYVLPKKVPYDQAEYSADYTKLRAAYQSGSDKYPELLDKMSEQFSLSGADQRRLVRSLNSSLPPEVRMFSRLRWTEQVKILDKATPEERELLLPHSNKEHVRRSWIPPEERPQQ